MDFLFVNMFIDFLEGGYMVFDIELQLFVLNIYRCRIPRKTSLNKSRKSLWINLGEGKVRFSGSKGPQKKLEKQK